MTILHVSWIYVIWLSVLYIETHQLKLLQLFLKFEIHTIHFLNSRIILTYKSKNYKHVYNLYFKYKS